MGSPVRFPFGVTTAQKQNPLGFFGQPDPTQWYTYFEDFDYFTVADWTITTVEAGAGAATEALTDGAGGLLLVTNDDADNDSDFFQKVGETVLMAAGKRTIGKVRFACSEATESEWYFGLMVADTDPFSSTAGDGVTDGIFFMKEDGSTNVSFYCQKNTTTGQIGEANVTTAAAAGTFQTLGFDFDGKRYIRLWKDDVQLETLDLGATVADYLPDTELTVSFGIKNGNAVARTLTVDYLFFAQER